MRTSLTPRSSSVADTPRTHSLGLDDSRHRDDLVPAHDERPRLAFRAGDLRVDENVLDLLAPPGEAIACPPGSYLKAWQVRLDAPRAPADLALQRDRCALEPDAVVLTNEEPAAAELDALAPDRRLEQLGDRRRNRPGVREAPQVQLGARVELRQNGQHDFADVPPLRVLVAPVGPELQAFGAAVLLGF